MQVRHGPGPDSVAGSESGQADGPHTAIRHRPSSHPSARLLSRARTTTAPQVLILLETEEVVEQPWRRQVKGGGSGAIRRVFDEHLELTADTGCTHFVFSLPPDASASFATPLLQLRWVLRFQFTAATSVGGRDWAPLQGPLETLSWALPVTVQPPAC